MSQPMRNSPTDPDAPASDSPDVVTKSYRGREVFMESLIAHGVEYIFGNPGTTEMPIMDSLVDYPQVSYVLALHESVALGAAHYYSQATGKTSVVNVHVGPGLGNTLGMLYNVWEANTPMVLTAGQQDTRMRLREPLLGHDLVAMAAPLTKWSVQAESADELGHLLQRAFKIAADPPQGPVFVSLPLNVLEEETHNAAMAPGRLYARSAPDEEGLRAAADLLLAAKRPVAIIGDGVARSGALREMVAISEMLGCRVFYEGLHHQISFPSSHPNFRDRMPFDYTGIRKALGDVDCILLVGGSFFEEIWFDEGSPFPSDARLIQIDASPQRLSLNFSPAVALLCDPRTGLSALLDDLEERADQAFRSAAEERNAASADERANELAGQRQRARDTWDDSPISSARLMAEIKAVAPSGTVIVNEAITATGDLNRTLLFERTGDFYGTRGGGIGQALPGALGVKIAHPDRPVIALSGDGSAMYSIQALWSAAHHDLPIVYIILHNRTYRILKLNMNIYRRRFGIAPDRPYPHMDLTEPDLDFVEMARGMGVEGRRITSPDEIGPAIESALEKNVPYLLDVIIDGRI